MKYETPTVIKRRKPSSYVHIGCIHLMLKTAFFTKNLDRHLTDISANGDSTS